jgi:Putative transposase, YhgA-like
MPGEAPTIREFVDRAIRELLSKPDNLRGFLGDVVPRLVSRFRFDKMRPAHREYFLGNWRSREADLIYEIPYQLDDRETVAFVCVLLEHQTQPDWRTPLKSFFYVASYWEWQYRLFETQERSDEPFLLTPVLPIVMFTGARPWGSVRRLHELIGEPTAFVPFAPDWSPQFWELAGHSADQLLHAPDAMLQVLSILRAAQEPTTDLDDVFCSILRQLNPMYESNHARWQDLVKFLLGWAHNRRPKQERGHWQSMAEQLLHEEERKREIKHMGDTIAQSIFEEGIREGIREGKMEGIREGKMEGIREGKMEGIREGKIGQARQSLLRLGRKLLSEPDAATIQTLEAIDDVERLNRMLEALPDLRSWTELLAVA